MESFPAIVLGFVQGITEFLPVSSSGHLALMGRLFSMEDGGLFYDTLLHFATMLATLVYFAKDIGYLFTGWCKGLASSEGRNSEGWSFGWAVIGGTVLTGALGMSLKPLVERIMVTPWAVGAGLMVTAAVLWKGSSLAMDLTGRPVTVRRGLLVGLVQGLAVLPGVSRSGTTIVAGMRSGLSAPSAFRFSFLLSVPAILGATLLQFRDLVKIPGWTAALPSGWILGLAVAFLSGLGALAIFSRLVARAKLRPFALYCGCLGAAIFFLSLFPHGALLRP